MCRGQVITLQIIVDVCLPIALNHVIAAGRQPHLVDGATKLPHLVWNLAPDILERRSIRILIDEDERSPGVDAKLRQADLGPVPVSNALEFGSSQEPSIQLVGPSMIGTSQYAC